MQNLHKTLLGQFPFLEDIRYMPSNYWLCSSKQLAHLFLRQPNSISIGLHLDPMIFVRFVYNNLLIHALISFSLKLATNH